MRRWQKMLLTAFALLLLLTAAAYWYLQKNLAALPLHNLQYQISSLSLRQLQLSSVSFSLDKPQLQVQLTDISINWQLLNSKITRLQLGSANIRLLQWPQTTDKNAAPATAPSLPADWQVPANFPDNINIDRLTLQLPCAASDCHYLLSAKVSHSAQQLQYRLTAADAATPTLPRLTLSGDYHAVQQLPVLNMQLELDNSTQLKLHQQLSSENGISANGELKLDIAPPSPWLIQQLKLWQPAIAQDALAQFTAPVSVQSNWQLQLPPGMDLAGIASHASGNWQLSANLPAPLTVPGIGQVQGTVQAELALERGELNRYQLNAQLAVKQPQLPEQLQQFGADAEQLQIAVSADGQSQPQLNALPLSFSISSSGDTTLQLAADATLNLTPPLSAALRNGRLNLVQKQLTLPGDVTAKNLTLNSHFNASWLVDSWQLALLNTEASIAQLNTADVQARDIRLVAASGQFSGDSNFNQTTLRTDVDVNVATLTQAQLKPLSWQWHGKLSGSTAALNIDGKLSNSASLGLSHQLRYTPDNTAVSWQLDEIFLLAGNPLSATLTAWPALLEFNRGRLSAGGEMTLLPDTSVDATLALSGINGIYDRSLFKELAGTLQMQYRHNNVLLATDNITVAEILHGVSVGPLALSAQYAAPVETPTAGKLNIQQLQLLAMGGKVLVQPVQLDLAQAQQQLQLELQQIDLSQLLQQHPTTDLTGNGRISGSIPLQLGSNGASVTDGSIAAESPGGKLQYRPSAAQGMAASNQGMKVVLNALDDFHYSVLSSNVSYDTSGKLLLALNLQGQNPALEQGRAINLNINLEEDIPALITSLQLSSQISDKIKQRVQQRIQQQRVNNANGVKP
ncbi:YdbH domain-containing protein [Rheinheimera sp. YQF-2]|uniref:YdbH domain-containing protein n=1 Tax=Rheinheimera lutimaris TaxID=2740584 RepID=A0A7Y5ATJ4_9GAMM|nr:YdbH domain-containing protein [Rheinheimera lutimaris]NRQ44089.1 YdbH domain-containing protein [Rheinheimera lutimaris]